MECMKEGATPSYALFLAGNSRALEVGQAICTEEPEIAHGWLLLPPGHVHMATAQKCHIGSGAPDHLFHCFRLSRPA